MSMTDLHKAFEIIDDPKNEADFMGPRSEELVRKAEEKLGIAFPPTYRQFLLKYGAGNIFGQEYYGVTRDEFDNATVPNGIWYTLDEREKYNLPAHLIVIASEDGITTFLDSSKPNAEGEYPVVEWDIHTGEITDDHPKIAEDFGEFLLNRTLEAQVYDAQSKADDDDE